MKQVNFRLEDDDYKLLKENAPYSYSVPSFCKILAKDFVRQLDNRNIIPEEMQFVSVDLRNEYVDNEVKVYFTDSQKNALEQAASRHGWSLSREIRHRVQMTLDDKMDFYDQELAAFNRTRNSVDVLGRNLNSIIVRDNAQIIDKAGFKSDVDNLQQQIASLKKELEFYIALCKGRRVYGKVGF